MKIPFSIEPCRVSLTYSLVPLILISLLSVPDWIRFHLSLSRADSIVSCSLVRIGLIEILGQPLRLCRLARTDVTSWLCPYCSSKRCSVAALQGDFSVCGARCLE